MQTNPNLIHALYNLAVLYNTNNKKNKAKKYLYKVLDVDGGDTSIRAKALAALKKLRDSERSGSYDWYGWWFGHGIPRIALGLALIAALIVIASPMLLMPLLVIDPAYLFNHNVGKLNTTSIVNNNYTHENIAGITIAIAVIVAILLLPSLHTFKLGPVELEKADPQSDIAAKNAGEQIGELVTPCHLNISPNMLLCR